MYSRASSASQKSLLDRSGQKLSFICSWWRKNNPDAESKWGLRVCYVKRRVPLYVSVCVGVGWTSPVRFTSISTAIGIPCTATHDHRHKPAGEPQSTVSWSWLGHGRSKEREMVRKMKEKWGRQLVPTNRLLSDFLTSDFFSLYLGLSLPHFHPPLPTHFQTFFSHHTAVSPSVGLAHRFTCCSITGGRGRPGRVCFLIWALVSCGITSPFLSLGPGYGCRRTPEQRPCFIILQSPPVYRSVLLVGGIYDTVWHLFGRSVRIKLKGSLCLNVFVRIFIYFWATFPGRHDILEVTTSLPLCLLISISLCSQKKSE